MTMAGCGSSRNVPPPPRTVFRSLLGTAEQTPNPRYLAGPPRRIFCMSLMGNAEHTPNLVDLVGPSPNCRAGRDVLLESLVTLLPPAAASSTATTRKIPRARTRDMAGDASARRPVDSIRAGCAGQPAYEAM